MSETDRRFGYLLRFFTPRTVFMEVVSSDCEISLRAAGYVERVWCVGAPPALGRRVRAPNVRLLRPGGINALAPESVDVAFSEGVQDLRAVERVLKKGGVYLCAEPPRGPFARWRSGIRVVARK